MLREINDLDTYHEVVSQLASLLVELSNKVTQAGIEKVKSNHSSKTNFKVCEDLKKTCKCKDKKNCQAVQSQRCFTEDYRNEFVNSIHNLMSMKAFQEVKSGKLLVIICLFDCS